MGGIFWCPSAVNTYFDMWARRKAEYNGRVCPHICNVVFADEDHLTVPRDSVAIASLFPNGEGQMFRGAGHALIVFNPVSVREQIEAFCLRHSKGSSIAQAKTSCRLFLAAPLLAAI